MQIKTFAKPNIHQLNDTHKKYKLPIKLIDFIEYLIFRLPENANQMYIFMIECIFGYAILNTQLTQQIE